MDLKIKKNAFTLAEVLITLSIIGVVTAITIPSLAYRYEQIKTVNKVKAFYSKMNNLLVHVIQNNAELKYLKWTNYNTNAKKSTEEFWAYFKPYLSVAQDCGTAQNSDCNVNKINYLKGGIHTIEYNNEGHYKMRTLDGGSMWVSVMPGHCSGNYRSENNLCGTLYYDVNGPKVPNTFGKDVFIFRIKSNEIIPLSNDDCRKTGEGLGCANYILLNENMNYLK